MSRLVRYTLSREPATQQGPQQIFEVTVAVQVISASGTTVAGASTHGTATLIASPVGRCVAGASTNGTAIHVGIPISRSVAGANAYGTATVITPPTPVGRCSGGANTYGTATHVAIPVGRCSGGALARGVAVHVGIPIARSVAGANAYGTARHVGIPIARSVAGASAYGTARHVGIPISRCVAGANAYGTARKIGSATGRSVAGASAYGSTFTNPTPIGRCSGGASAYGTSFEIAIPVGRSVAGASTYGTALQPISVSGVCSAGALAYGVAAQGGDVVMDTQVLPLAQALRDCLCAWTSVNPNPPALCCFRVGSEIAHDAGLNEDICCRGMSYVSIGDIWPSSAGFPEADITRQANSNCFPPAWGVQLRAGIIRCVPTGGEDPPTCPEWAEAHEQVGHDSQALRKAACCIRAFVQNSTQFLGMSIVINRQVQTNPLGGCVERYMTVDIQIPNLDCC